MEAGAGDQPGTGAELTERLLAHLAAYPDRSFTGYELGRKFGVHGTTVKRALLDAAAAGTVTQEGAPGDGKGTRITFQHRQLDTE